MRLLPLLTLAVVFAGCKAPGEPDLCRGFEPHCEGNVGIICYTVTDCDQCSYYRHLARNDCDYMGLLYGVSRTCKVGRVHGHSSAVCVDTSETPCGMHEADEIWCAGLGKTAVCYETVDGPLVSSGVSCYDCACNPNPRPDAGRDTAPLTDAGGDATDGE